jgi:hypothetical protein
MEVLLDLHWHNPSSLYYTYGSQLVEPIWYANANILQYDSRWVLLG